MEDAFGILQPCCALYFAALVFVSIRFKIENPVLLGQVDIAKNY